MFLERSWKNVEIEELQTVFNNTLLKWGFVPKNTVLGSIATTALVATTFLYLQQMWNGEKTSIAFYYAVT